MTVIARMTSERKDGAMGRVSELNEESLQRREDFAKRLLDLPTAGKSIEKRSFAPVQAGQEHGIHVAFVDEKDAGKIIPRCDGLITSTPNLPLMIGHQDCVPIFLWSEDEKMVGLLHAGWRGVLKGILHSAVTLIQSKRLAEAESLSVHFGASIQPCHFFVKEDVAEAFREKGFVTAVKVVDQQLRIDLFEALTLQAQQIGIPAENITKDDRCTFCTKEKGEFLFSSWRRDGDASQNAVSTIAIVA